MIQESVPETLKNHYELLEHHAMDCIECGHCMKNCPFGVDIIKKMKQPVNLFEIVKITIKDSTLLRITKKYWK